MESIKDDLESKRYAALIDMTLTQSDIYTWEYHVDEDRYYRNGPILKRYGYPEDTEFSAVEFFQLIHPDQVETVQNVFRDILTTGEKKSVECKVKIKYQDKEVYEWFRYQASPLDRAEDGTVKIIIGTASCIEKFVEEHEALIRLKKQAEKNNQLLNKAFVLGNIIPFVWVLKTDLVYITSPNLKDKENVFDLTTNGISAKSMLESVHPEDRCRFAAVADGLKNGSRSEAVVEFRYKKDGHYEDVEVHLLTFFDKNAPTEQKIVGYMQNISVRKKLEKQKNKRKDMLQAIIDEVPIPVFLRDVEGSGRYVYWNHASEKLFAEGSDRLVREVWSPKDAENILKVDNEVYQTGITYNGYEAVTIADGRSYETVVTKKKISDGEHDLILTVRYDLSAQKEQQRNRSILSVSMDAFGAYVWRYDPAANRFYFSNSIGKDRNSADIKEVDFDLLYSRVHPEDKEKFKTELQQFFVKESGNFSLVCRIDYENSGEYQWRELRGIIELTQHHGQTQKNFYGIDLNINRKMLMITELEKAKAKAEESDKLKSTFLANMSHEIRTPLNAIVGFSELIKNTDDPVEKEEYFNIVATNNDILLHLIGDILDLSKIEAGFLEFKRERINLSVYFEYITASLKQRITNPNIEYIVDNPHENLMVLLDKNRYAQIVTNFVSNAIKYTKDGSIRVGYAIEDGGIRTYVTDTGIGIPREKQDRLFRQFEKLDSFAQGTGLGLSISKAIMDAAGGKIGFESVENEGSTFWAWFAPVSPLECE